MKANTIVSWFLFLFLFLVIAFGYVLNSQIDHISKLANDIYEYPMTINRASLSAARELTKIHRNFKELIIEEDQNQFPQIISEINDFLYRAMGNLKLVEERSLDSTSKELIANTLNLSSAMIPLKESIITSIKAQKIDEAEALINDQGEKLMDDIEEAINKIINFSESQRMKFQIETLSDLKRTKIIIFSVGLIILLLIAVFTILLASSFLKPFAKIKQKFQRENDQDPEQITPLSNASAGSTSELINKYFSQVKTRVLNLQQKNAALKEELSRNTNINADLKKQIIHLDHTLKSLNQQSTTLREDEKREKNQNLYLIDNLKQIRGDLLMIAQVTNSQALTLTTLDQKQNNQEHIERLKQKAKSLHDYAQKSVDNVKVLLDELDQVLQRNHQALVLNANYQELSTLTKELKTLIKKC